MMSNNRAEYGSAAEWLTALRQDDAWLYQLQRLQDSSESDFNIHCDDAIRRIGNGETYEFWDIYQHKVEPVVEEVWQIAELSLIKLKIQAIGMLSIEWLEQHAKTNSAPSEKKKRVAKKSEKSEKPRETMTFHHKACVLDGHLTLLFDKLTKAGWISGEEAHFKALFSGELDEACQLTWISGYGKGTLVELFKQMVGAKLVIVPKGFTLSAILEGHFTGADGKWLTGLDKGNAANDKAMPFIQECVNLLKMSPNGYYDDDEDFKSEYDPFDHQDLNLHKR